MRRWISWTEHLQLLSNLSLIAVQTNVFAPFGLRNLVINGQGLGAQGTEGTGAHRIDPSVRAVVLTADNMPTLYLLRLLLPYSTNTMLLGPAGEFLSASVT